MLLGTLYHDTVSKLDTIYASPERESVAMLLLQDILKVSRRQILLNENVKLDPEALKRLSEGIDRCQTHEPVQHITGITNFYGHDFQVSTDVLIPRPETEELVNLILRSHANQPLRALDIGTGSGCIAITLSLEHQQSDIMAMDISEAALSMARKNAENLGAEVAFYQADVLTEELPVTDLDVIVSNPPYIPEMEKESMARRVVNYEPSLALYVPDSDPLLFYRRIGMLAKKHLKPGGILYVEINENYGYEVQALYAAQGYHKVMCLQDMQRKDRIVRAIRPA